MLVIMIVTAIVPAAALNASALEIAHQVSVDLSIENYVDNKNADDVSAKIENEADAYVVNTQILLANGNEYNGILAEDTKYHLSVTIAPNDVPDTSLSLAELQKENVTLGKENTAISIDYNADENTLTAVFELEELAHEHVCGELIPEKPAVHTSTELKAGMKAHYYCEECNKYLTEEKVATTKSKLVIPLPAHDYATENGYKGADGHANTCACGAQDTLKAHDDTDKDGKCDACAYELPKPETPTPKPTATTPKPTDPAPTEEPESDGGCGGIVGGAAVALAAILALGAGVVLKKKD